MNGFSVRILAALLIAGPALAQDDPLEPGGGAMQDDGLAERKAAEQPVLDDPDGTLLKQTDTLRSQVETTINKLQESVQKMREIEVELTSAAAKKFEGFDKRLERVTGDMLKATDAYMEKHAADLEAYRTALGQGLSDAKDKAGKAVIKSRQTFIAALSKVQKSAETLAKDADAFAAKFAPAAAPVSEAAPASDAPEEPEEGGGKEE